MEVSTAYQETVDTDTFHPQGPAPADTAQEVHSSQVLPLPAPGGAAASGRSGGEGAQLDLGNGAVQMDHLGPMVVGEDGSLSRIANWAKLSEREQEIAMRRITARNRERLARLRGGAGQAEVLGAALAPAVPGQQQQGTSTPEQS